MSRPREWNVKAAVMQYFTALLLSLGMSLTALGTLLPGQQLWPALLLCAGFTLVFHLFIHLKMRLKWLLPLFCVLALALWGALGGGPGYTLVQSVRAAGLSLRGVTDALSPYADWLRLIICLIFSLMAAALAWDNTLALALFSVPLVICLCLIFSASEQLIFCALPAAAGLLMMMAQNRRDSLSPLPVALAVALLAALLLPGSGKTVPALKQAADSIRQFAEDYLFFNEYRASFSLASEGYLPLDGRLGGEATPLQHSVMEVQTDRTVLLRGRAYDDYSGLSWYDSLSSQRYLYLSPRYTAQRDELFDLKRPLAGAEGMEPAALKVHMLAPATSTLFSPLRGRTLQLDGERMVLYYNLASELFLTRNLETGDVYTVTYLPFAPEDATTETAIAACQKMQDAHYDQAAAQYLSLPRHIQQEIYDIAAQATRGAETPYEKALAIQNYLRSHYTYTLKPQTPPEGVDFAAWFLLGEKEGYCTYFATAMTILCRISGIPARYVTGFLVVPDENGMALVTGENAHAWTEVYLNGFGWLDFDPTPRSDNDRRAPEQDSDAQTPPPAENAPTPSPTPSPSPAPEDEAPAESPTPSPEEKGASGEEEPSPSPAPSQAPLPTQAPQEPPEASSAFPWRLLLLVLTLVLLALLRFFATDPVRLSARRPEEAAWIYFEALCGLMALENIRRMPQETLHDFALRADKRPGASSLPALLPLADALAAQVYGRHAAPWEPFREAYLTALQALPRRQRLRLALGRMLSLKGQGKARRS